MYRFCAVAFAYAVCCIGFEFLMQRMRWNNKNQRGGKNAYKVRLIPCKEEVVRVPTADCYPTVLPLSRIYASRKNFIPETFYWKKLKRNQYSTSKWYSFVFQDLTE